MTNRLSETSNVSNNSYKQLLTNIKNSLKSRYENRSGIKIKHIKIIRKNDLNVENFEKFLEEKNIIVNEFYFPQCLSEDNSALKKINFWFDFIDYLLLKKKINFENFFKVFNYFYNNFINSTQNEYIALNFYLDKIKKFNKNEIYDYYKNNFNIEVKDDNQNLLKIFKNITSNNNIINK